MTALVEHAEDDLVLPASAYAEALVAPAARGGAEVAKAKIKALMLRIEPIGETLAERAAVLLTSNPPLRLPDAFVLACGEALGADAVLTADRRWRRFDRVRVLG